MNRAVPIRRDSDEFADAVRGTVLANRAVEILSAPGTKRHDDYLALVREQLVDDTAADPADEYRARAKSLVPRALDAYDRKHGVEVRRNLFFRHPETKFRIGAAPDAVEGRLIGITVHCRQELKSYEAAREKGLTTEMIRQAQAMMVVTGLPYWLHINYFEDAETRTRKLSEIEIQFDKIRAAEIEAAMIEFLAQTRGVAA